MAESTRDKSGRVSAVLGAFALVATLACVSRWTGEEPLQGWWAERGPVVPHDTFPADCSLCHVGGGWTEIKDDFQFDHAAETGVALQGAHAEAQCLRCHNDRGPTASFAARGCAGCHEDVHRGLMGKTCSICHDEETWRPDAGISMHASTRFPLVGAHAAAACWRCHPGSQSGNFAPVSAECVTCHAADLASAVDPDHIAQGWVDDCGDCHVPTSWDGAGFTHGSWPLTGAHSAADCSACHTGGMFVGTPNDCVDCHLMEYTATTDPDHDVLGFDLNCALCHDTSAWEGAQFAHTGIVTGCVDCHLPDYQATTDPDHVAQGFSLDCEDCHGTNTWFGATFDHAGISSGCADCHIDDYFATTDPNHAAAGFPTTCEACHTSFVTWDDADFNHLFDIQGGDHAGMSCSDCHQVPGTFVNPSCTHCHEHSLSEMADEHSDVRGYVWASPGCIMCHPTGDK